MNIDIEVNLDIEKAIKKLNSMRKEINKTLREFRSIENKLKKGYFVFDKFSGTFSDTDATVYIDELNELEKKYKSLRRSVNIANRELRKWNSELEKVIAGGKTKYAINEITSNIEKQMNKIDEYSRKLEAIKARRAIILDTFEVKKPSKIEYDDEKRVMEKVRRRISEVKALTEETKNIGIATTVQKTNRELKSVYDTLKSTKATRMNKNLQLFTASIFEGIMSAFDDRLNRVMRGSEEINEITLGRRLAGMAVKPEQFYLKLYETIFGGNMKAFSSYMERFGAKITESDIMKDRTGRYIGINVGIDPLKVIRDLMLGGGKELKLSGQLRTGLAQGMIMSFGVGLSSLTAKIGIIGVILKKIYEVMEKMVSYSGVMSASLKLLTMITQLSIKPVADVLGSIILPILMLVIKVLVPIIKKWDKVFASWMRFSKEHPKTAYATQLTTTLVGLSQGGAFGGFAGALLPMMATYFMTGKSAFGRTLAGVSIFPLMYKMIGGSFSNLSMGLPKSVGLFGESIAKVTKVTAQFGKAMILTRGAVIKEVLSTNTAFGSLIKTVGGVISKLTYFGIVLLGFYELLELTKSFFQGKYNTMKEGAEERKWKFHPFAHYENEEFNTPNAMIGEQVVWETKRWEAMAKYYPEDWSRTVGENINNDIEELKKLTDSVDISEFDKIISDVDNIENNWTSFTDTVKSSSANVRKTGDDLSNSSVDLFNAMLSPIDSAYKYWDKNGDEIFYSVRTLRNTIVNTINSATGEMSKLSSMLNTRISKLTTGGGGRAGEYIRKYQTGGWVDETGLAIVHKGEYVVPREHAFAIADILRSGIYRKGIEHDITEVHNHIDVNVNVDSISSEIDLHDIADRISDILLEKIRMHTGGL